MLGNVEKMWRLYCERDEKRERERDMLPVEVEISSVGGRGCTRGRNRSSTVGVMIGGRDTDGGC